MKYIKNLQSRYVKCDKKNGIHTKTGNNTDAAATTKTAISFHFSF